MQYAPQKRLLALRVVVLQVREPCAASTLSLSTVAETLASTAGGQSSLQPAANRLALKQLQCTGVFTCWYNTYVRTYVRMRCFCVVALVVASGCAPKPFRKRAPGKLCHKYVMSGLVRVSDMVCFICCPSLLRTYVRFLRCVCVRLRAAD